MVLDNKLAIPVMLLNLCPVSLGDCMLYLHVIIIYL